MKTIWKYTLSPNQAEFEMPKGAKILSVQVQHDNVCMWVELEGTETNFETRIIETFGTGQVMDEKKREFIGTFQLHGGTLVFHVYELLEVER